MDSALLFWTYMGVMVIALGCFARAYHLRLDTPRHKRWGQAGVLLALGGIVVVLLATYLWGWRVRERYPDVVLWHRRVAYGATALLVLTGLSGWQRWRAHPTIARWAVAVFVVALSLAAVGYRP